jgi:hypothetical protein
MKGKCKKIKIWSISFLMKRRHTYVEFRDDSHYRRDPHVRSNVLMSTSFKKKSLWYCHRNSFVYSGLCSAVQQNHITHFFMYKQPSVRKNSL